MIRVLVIDDSLFIRTVVQDMLSDDPDIQIVGVASDGLEALDKIRELKPDLITLDSEMPRLDGLSMLERKKEIDKFPKTLVLSSLTSEGAEMTKRAIALGADDFMLKPRGIKNIREIGGELKHKDKKHLYDRVHYVKTCDEGCECPKYCTHRVFSRRPAHA
jgi:Chemotaxis response regulator containing a CheY-like receiver domain and a methylesterase domain